MVTAGDGAPKAAEFEAKWSEWSASKPPLAENLTLVARQCHNHHVASQLRRRTRPEVSPARSLLVAGGVVTAFSLVEGLYVSLGLSGVSLTIPYSIGGTNWVATASLWAVVAVSAALYAFRLPSATVYSKQMSIVSWTVSIAVVLALVEAIFVAPICTQEFSLMQKAAEIGGMTRDKAIETAHYLGLDKLIQVTTTTTTAPPASGGILGYLLDRGLCHGMHEAVWLSLHGLFASASMLLVLWGVALGSARHLVLRATLAADSIVRSMATGFRWRYHTCKEDDGRVLVAVERQSQLSQGLVSCLSRLPISVKPRVDRFTFLGMVNANGRPHGPGVFQRRRLAEVNGYRVYCDWHDGEIDGKGSLTDAQSGLEFTLECVGLLRLTDGSVVSAVVQTRAGEPNHAQVLSKKSQASPLPHVDREEGTVPLLVYVPGYWATDNEALRDAGLLSSKGRCRAVCARWKTGDADEVRAFSNLVRDARSRGFIPTVILHARALIVAESLLEQAKAMTVVVLDVTEDCRRSAWCSQAERVVLYALRPEPFLKNEKRNSPEEEPLVPDDLLTENNSVQVVLTPRRPAEWHHWLRTPAVASWASAPLLHDISNVSYLFVLYRSFLAVRAGFGDWPVDCGKQ